MYLLPVASVLCHHFPQSLQHFDAEALLVLLQQLLGVFDQPARVHYITSLIYNEYTFAKKKKDI